jgi:Gylcosyl hydrolase family 115 C-terminal domain
MAWSSQVRWPWGQRTSAAASGMAKPDQPPAGQGWRDAATADRQTSSGDARWAVIEGLGPSGRAMALQAARVDSSWSQNDAEAPALTFDFNCTGGDAEALLDFLPTFRLYPGMKLRVAVSVDNGAPVLVQVPGSSGAENENGLVRSSAVQNNYVRAPIPLRGLAAGRHTLTIRAVDPGVVLDQISLP